MLLRIRNTLKAHADSLRPANIWEIDTQSKGARPLRKSRYVAVTESKSESSSSEAELPLNRLAGKLRRERENSDSEDNIPLMELAKRLKSRENAEKIRNNYDTCNSPRRETDRSGEPVSTSGQSEILGTQCISSDQDKESETMDINFIKRIQGRKPRSKRSREKQVPKEKVHTLLPLVGSIL